MEDRGGLWTLQRRLSTPSGEMSLRTESFGALDHVTTSPEAPRRHGFWKRVWLRMQAQRRGRPLVRWMVRHGDREFTVQRSEVGEAIPEETVVPWTAIERVEAFKRDCLTTDLVCVGMALVDGSWIEVHEEMPGFLGLIEALPRYLHGCPPPERWSQGVELPPFETNHTVLWRRDGRDA